LNTPVWNTAGLMWVLNAFWNRSWSKTFVWNTFLIAVAVGSNNCWKTSLSKIFVWNTLGIVKITCSLNSLVRSIIPTASLTTFLSSLAYPVPSVIPTLSNGAVLVLPILLDNNSTNPTESDTVLLICGIIFLTVVSVIPIVS